MSNNPFQNAESAFESVDFDGKKIPKDFVEKLRASLSAEIRAEIEPAIRREATDAALRGLKDHWRKELSKRIGIQEIETAETFRDAVELIADRLKHAGGQQQQQSQQQQQQQQQPQQQQIDADKLRAQIRGEMEKEFARERRALKEKTIYEQLTAAAIARGLDARYRDLVPDMIAKKFVVEFGEDGNVVYRDKNGAIILDGANDPTPEFLVGKIAADYKEIFVQPKNGTGAAAPNASGGNNAQTFRDTVEMIAAAIKTD